MKTKRLLLFCLALGMLGLWGCRSPGAGSHPGKGAPSSIPGTPEWRESSTPIVKEYLTTLPEDAIGSELDGIRLSDGKRWFQGHTYLGRPGDLPPLLRATVLRAEGRVVAFMWLEEGGEPFPLQQCEGEESGIRARSLAGEVHVWRSLRAEHGVIYTSCPPAHWLPASESED